MPATLRPPGERVLDESERPRAGIRPAVSEENPQQAGIDWAASEVDDAVLAVPVAGEPPKGWAERVEHVVARLVEHGSSPWESIEITHERVTVTGVQPGTEEDVRYLIDAAVTQANADVAEEADDRDDGSGNEADRDMADTFRSFGEKPDDG